VIERNGVAVARVTPSRMTGRASLRAVVAAWRSAGEPDASFADDLERIGSLDQPTLSLGGGLIPAGVERLPLGA
jgi:hypothetical protein